MESKDEITTLPDRREAAPSFGHKLTRDNAGSQPQRGIIHYGLSPNRQNPFAGAGHDAVFNTWRRFSGQVLYWLPPFIGVYYILDWAQKRYVIQELALDMS